MKTVFNLDLNKKNHPTSFAYQVPSNTQEMYFRIIENDYVIDYSKFNVLNLRFEFEDGTIYTGTTSNFTTYQDEKIVEYKIPSNYLKSIGTAIVTPTVKLSNKTVILSPFKLVIFEGTSTEMNGILTATNYFNHMLSLYYDSIKRDQINQPNGVIGLNSNGDIPLEYFPNDFRNHITDKLVDTASKKFYDKNGQEIGIHGLKFDEKWRLCYYDVDDDEFYVANSIHSGKFGYPNKSSAWNVYGGTWGTPTINAGLFTQSTNKFVDGGTFKDSLSGEIDANFIDGGVVMGDAVFGGTFK